MSMRPETKAAALRAAAARGALQLPTTGTSMGGMIDTGSSVSVEPGTRPRWGEVWVFCLADDRVVVHRCRGRRGEAWLFQGDRRAAPDPLVATEQLVGRVTAVHTPGQGVVRLGALDRWVRGALAAVIRLRHR